MAYTPECGDIIHLKFDPATGSEMKGPHFCVVVSQKVFNRLGLAIVCHISQCAATTARTIGTLVTLMGSGTNTQGTVHCHQVKSLDWRYRKAKYKESVPNVIIDEVLARLEAIIIA